ncbi:MAG TPA: amidohydrolase [Ruminococcaceae bacterium]|nr:amidohydrolase [Oscillospiraceae bacterium]
MLFKNIYYLDENLDVKTGCILTEKDIIKSISQTVPENYSGESYDGKNKLLMPSLINSHSHIPMTLLRGYGDGLPLDEWLFKRVFPFEDQLDDEAVSLGTQLGLAEMLASGTANYSDMYMFCDTIAEETIKAGLKANISRGVTVFDDRELHELPSFEDTKRLYEKYNNAADGRILVDTSMHAEYTSSQKAVAAMAEYTASIKARCHIHLSETEKEHNECKQRRNGRTPAKYMLDCGIFKNPTTAAHCVFAEPQDIEIFASNGVSVVHNPASNLKLGSGIAPIQKMLDAGVNVCLGTDGASSNNNLNMFEEMNLAAMVHKGVNRAPLMLSAKEIVKMATINGAKQQGRADTGVIAQGKKADLIVIDMDKPHLYPRHDILSNLIFSAQGADVVLTMCDGRILYKNGIFTTLDVEKIYFGVEKSLDRIAKRLVSR